MFKKPNARDMINYVLSRRGVDGGYLSYQYMGLFESSVEDTYYALTILKLLGVEPPNKPDTLNFLKEAQLPEGNYSSLRVAFFAIKALASLDEKPRDVNGAVSYLKETLESMLIREVDSFQQPMEFERKNYVSREIVEKALKSVDLYDLYVIEMPTVLCNVNMATSALNLIGHKLSKSDRENILRLVLGFKNEDGGFGLSKSYIDDTFHALCILVNLENSLEDLGLQDTIRWIYECEDRSGGFKIEPEIPFSYSLEYTYYGLQAMRFLNVKPLFQNMHVNFIYKCYNPNGGFRRSINLGISTLEDTFYAVSSLSMLNAIPC